ncbi:hypothetical protein SPRG_20313 [Saprolegnia parasitica CBS 223.65]|uniref:Uncharacterized protein n=1 Tax=Saprolegnia parasitica (strain CBS 223.65) TaxID=695850 RepID=A0A067CEJ4_SAPPC|nr:hypothetical protein SPRG_20313 [Saprolegnia parasitica CBS 223.65]KDO27600.1 hypothetical protein SPRG_20313 [Saprolegnia parasitica CBS 223.65]|eukprot:XP_012201784.1 hypothetical protein SPRG_20313 [Saprolegnia parasitica CBS 223.65]
MVDAREVVATVGVVGRERAGFETDTTALKRHHTVVRVAVLCQRIHKIHDRTKDSCETKRIAATHEHRRVLLADSLRREKLGLDRRRHGFLVLQLEEGVRDRAECRDLQETLEREVPATLFALLFEQVARQAALHWTRDRHPRDLVGEVALAVGDGAAGDEVGHRMRHENEIPNGLGRRLAHAKRGFAKLVLDVVVVPASRPRLQMHELGRRAARRMVLDRPPVEGPRVGQWANERVANTMNKQTRFHLLERTPARRRPETEHPRHTRRRLQD